MTLKEYLAFLEQSRAENAIADTEEGDGQEEPINDPHAPAIHEAGHAVIADVLGLGPLSASVLADGESLGRVIYPDIHDTFNDMCARGKMRSFHTIWRGRILSAMAGRAAEQECLGTCCGGEASDDYAIGCMFQDLPEGDTRLDRMRSLARGLVRKHRAAIERVAAALERNKVLDGETIRQLVRGLDRGQPGGA